MIASVDLAIPGRVAAAIAAAERSLGELEAVMGGSDIATAEAATFALLRSESLSSSRIEGLSISHRRLAETLYDPGSAKQLAREVVSNLKALEQAILLGAERDPLTVNDIVALHRTLMESVPGVKAGEVRNEQNWIGASNSPADAAYIPPPPGEVGRLLEDLAAFTNRNDISPVLQAAVAHAQFEAIHPFVDGNGRVGRCLTSVVLRRRSSSSVTPPISGVLLSNTSLYYDSLRSFQQEGNPWPWVAQFAESAVKACDTTKGLVRDIDSLQSSWIERSGRPRQGSVTMNLIRELPQISFTDAEQVAQRLGVDANVARRGLNALEAAGILSQVAGSKRNRVWRADEMHELLDSYGANFGRDLSAGT